MEYVFRELVAELMRCLDSRGKLSSKPMAAGGNGEGGQDALTKQQWERWG